MKIRFYFLTFLSAASLSLTNAQSEARLSVTNTSEGELIVAAGSEFHDKYGLAFPMTYKLEIPLNSQGLTVWEKHSASQDWYQLTEKTSSDVFNDIEAVRFDYPNQTAYVSAAFSGETDTIYLKAVNNSQNIVEVNYEGVTKYYDNRDAVVTITFDDYQVAFVDMIHPLVNLFVSYGLYMTAAIITSYSDAETWAQLQGEVNTGYIEVASHSRNHIHTPYGNDAVSEIAGSYDDITSQLELPQLYNVNGKEYVYTWIAPYGDYDETVDSILGTKGYLVARLYENLSTDDPREYIYGDSTFSKWDDKRNHFEAFLPSVELGAPSWGGGDTSLTSLNNLFDTIIGQGGIYHLMWHPQVIIDDTNKTYLTSHLEYISGRNNLWYVPLGSLYLYHLIQSQNSEGNATAIAENSVNKVETFNLSQNYPNPFNPSTTIAYSVPEVETQHAASVVQLKVYDILGNEVATLVNKKQLPGRYEVKFSAKGGSASGENVYNLASGIYIYRLITGDFVSAKKMLLLR